MNRAPIRKVLAVAFFALAPAALPSPASATFHLNEFTKVMTGYNGNTAIQAVELKMLVAGESLVSGISIDTYDAAGNLVANLGTFPSSLPNSASGAHILCATAQFQSTFGITADLTITPGLAVGTGQVSFEKATCFVNAIAYGNVTTPKDGTTSAAALPSDLAYVLVRTVDDGTGLFCPLAEDAAARMSLVSANSASPVTFTNNAGATVNVFSTLTGVDAVAAPASARLAIFPNPVRAGARVTAPGEGRLTIHDASGRRVRALAPGSASAALWDGRDEAGRMVASGVYFLRYEAPSGSMTRRFVVAR